MTATRVLEAQNGRNYGLDHSFCLSSYKDCTPLSPSFRIIMLSRRTIIIQSFLSGGMLKAIDFPLWSALLFWHPSQTPIDTWSVHRGSGRERELVCGYYCRLTSHGKPVMVLLALNLSIKSIGRSHSLVLFNFLVCAASFQNENSFWRPVVANCDQKFGSRIVFLGPSCRDIKFECISILTTMVGIVRVIIATPPTPCAVQKSREL